MSKQTTLAEGINPVGTELIGKTVYFQAKRVIKINYTSVKSRFARNLDGNKRPGGNKPFYDVIPGTVLQVTPTGVGIEAAGGLYNRRMADIVQPEDLDHWMHRNPGKLVMRGDQ